MQEIIALNKTDQKPADLVEGGFDEPEVEPDYADVVGQDSLTRMDKRRKKKKKKRKKKKSFQPKQQQ